MNTNKTIVVKAFWKAIQVEEAQSPYNVIQLKIFYPSENDAARNPFSIAPAATDLAPFPVVVFFNGFNCSLSVYEWLAIDLAKCGLVVVLFDWLVSRDKITFLTPGVDLSAFSKQNYGTMPSASALPLLLAELDNLQSDGVLSGLLDLGKIVLGGHSAGGRLALENAEPKFFERVIGAFSYGAHSASPVQLGHAPGTILPLPSSLPMLIIGGTEDGVIANNSQIYGMEQWQTPATPVIRTFREGICSQGDSSLIIIEGANHFAIAHPTDSTLTVAEADFPSTRSEPEIRSLIASIIGLFIDTFVLDRSNKSQFKQSLEKHNSAIALSEFKQ